MSPGSPCPLRPIASIYQILTRVDVILRLRRYGESLLALLPELLPDFPPLLFDSKRFKGEGFGYDQHQLMASSFASHRF